MSAINKINDGQTDLSFKQEADRLAINSSEENSLKSDRERQSDTEEQREANIGIHFDDLQYQRVNSSQASEGGFLASLCQSLSESEAFKVLSPILHVGAILSIPLGFFFAKDSTAKKTSFIVGGLLFLGGLLQKKVIEPFVNKVAKPVTKAIADINKLIMSDESKQRLREVLKRLFNIKSPLQEAATGQQVGAQQGRALMLHGPPGTGKTYLAEAIANKAGKGIIKATVSQVESKFYGETEKNIEKLFQRGLEENAVVFLDDFDSLFVNRNDNGSSASHDMRTVSSLLQTMDDKRYRDVIFIVSTNIPNKGDAAFKARTIPFEMDAPTLDQRLEIFMQKLQGQNLKPEYVEKVLVQKDKIKQLLSKNEYDGITGRYLEGAVRTAVEKAGSRFEKNEGEAGVTLSDIEVALKEVNDSRIAADKSGLGDTAAEKLLSKMMS